VCGFKCKRKTKIEKKAMGNRKKGEKKEKGRETK
jgi:hypothetical protein